MNLPERKCHRLKDFDYGSYGYYYVTICTLHKQKILCTVGSDAPVAPHETGETVRSDALVTPHETGETVGSDALVTPFKIGRKVIECFNNIAKLNENIEIDKFVLMPNHIHGIIIIKNEEPIEIKEKKYAFEIEERRGRRSLQGLIKDFKSVTTRYYKKMYNTNLSLWQESFYDEIIKNQEHYYNVWQYIDTNPINWDKDDYYE